MADKLFHVYVSWDVPARYQNTSDALEQALRDKVADLENMLDVTGAGRRLNVKVGTWEGGADEAQA